MPAIDQGYRCDYCGGTIRAYVVSCPNCGAPTPSAPRIEAIAHFVPIRADAFDPIDAVVQRRRRRLVLRRR